MSKVYSGCYGVGICLYVSGHIIIPYNGINQKRIEEMKNKKNSMFIWDFDFEQKRYNLYPYVTENGFGKNLFQSFEDEINFMVTMECISLELEFCLQRQGKKRDIIKNGKFELKNGELKKMKLEKYSIPKIFSFEDDEDDSEDEDDKEEEEEITFQTKKQKKGGK